MRLWSKPKTSADHPVRADAPRQERIVALGTEWLEAARCHERGHLGLKFYQDRLIDFAMRDEAFKVELFRFVDCFPTLTTPESIHEHLQQYLLRPGLRRPPGFEAGLALGGLAKGAVAATMARQIRGMAQQFIAGETPSEAAPVLRRRWDQGIAFSVDLLGEVCVSAAEADAYLARYLQALEQLSREAATWPARDALDQDHLGTVPRVNLSLKLSALTARFLPADPDGTAADLQQRLAPLLRRAGELGAHLNLDIEAFAFKDLTLQVFEALAEASDAPLGLAMQAYLRSGRDDAARLVAWTRRTGRTVTVRLVKGAYWDYENVHAEIMGWPVPVWPTKPETDACFEDMARIFLEATPRAAGEGGVKLAMGSHNVRSIAAALVDADSLGLPRSAVELQMLYGMGDPHKAAAADLGLRVREYVPLGQMVPGMSYLVRRLLENTSNESWLKAEAVDRAAADRLLGDPKAVANGRAHTPANSAAQRRQHHALSAAVPGVGDGSAFDNEPLRDFSQSAPREAFAQTLAAAVVPQVALNATEADADQMLAQAEAAWPRWRETEPVVRANLLLRAADLLRQRRDKLAAVVVLEAGKPWLEADADVCEAIDFCEYYARQAVALFQPQRLGRFVGELDTVWYEPRGVTAVVSPWNFPAAIACGMTVAALVCGNPAILKPAGQTPAIARLLCEALWEAGVPRDVLHFCPGPGRTVGARLVADPRVAVVAFTGSREVGLELLRTAGTLATGQVAIKKTVLELGGKNAVVVDSSADLDEAVLGVRDAAFGYQGQKCSACSRVLVVDSEGGPTGPYETFLRRLGEATRALVIGDVRDPATQFGPVIDAAAQAKIREYVALGEAEARAIVAAPVPTGLEAATGRAYVGPHVFADVPTDSRLWTEEIFGPVLSVRRAATFAEALQWANDCPFKLTGGVFSRTPAHLDLARREFRVGNLYLNRGTTGALVSRQPFGGFGHSGVGSKAGGADYLLQFVVPRACCENTLRHGFAPTSES